MHVSDISFRIPFEIGQPISGSFPEQLLNEQNSYLITSCMYGSAGEQKSSGIGSAI